MSEPATCRNCGHGLHPVMPCEGRNFIKRPCSCPGTRGWVSLSYAGMNKAGVTINEAYVAKTIQEWMDKQG